MIELRTLAITDLSMTFARDMGGNKIRHYRVPASQMMISKFTGQTPEQIVREHIKREEGDVEVKVLPSRVTDKYFLETPKNAFQMKEIADVFLKDDPKLKKSLEKMRSDSLVYQYNIDLGWFKKLTAAFGRVVNRFLIDPINQYLREWQLKDVPLEDRFAYLDEVSNLKLLPCLPESGYVRAVSPCSFLTVGFHEDDIEAATNQLLNDLRYLDSKGLIMGHLVMPSMILLADTIGSGKGTYAMFCFLFLDYQKLQKLTGKTLLEMPNYPLKELLGIKSECREGDVNWLNDKDPISRYEVETVNVADIATEQGRKAVIENYTETREFVNEAAKSAKARYESAQILNKTSENVNGHVIVSADIKDKNGNIETLGDKYRRNE